MSHEAEYDGGPARKAYLLFHPAASGGQFVSAAIQHGGQRGGGPLCRPHGAGRSGLGLSGGVSSLQPVSGAWAGRHGAGESVLRRKRRKAAEGRGGHYLHRADCGRHPAFYSGVPVRGAHHRHDGHCPRRAGGVPYLSAHHAGRPCGLAGLQCQQRHFTGLGRFQNAGAVPCGGVRHQYCAGPSVCGGVPLGRGRGGGCHHHCAGVLVGVRHFVHQPPPPHPAHQPVLFSV